MIKSNRQLVIPTSVGIGSVFEPNRTEPNRSVRFATFETDLGFGSVRFLTLSVSVRFGSKKMRTDPIDQRFINIFLKELGKLEVFLVTSQVQSSHIRHFFNQVNSSRLDFPSSDSSAFFISLTRFGSVLNYFGSVRFGLAFLEIPSVSVRFGLNLQKPEPIPSLIPTSHSPT